MVNFILLVSLTMRKVLSELPFAHAGHKSEPNDHDQPTSNPVLVAILR